MLKSSAYVAEIDGLRAYAVLAVLLFHGFPAIGIGGFIGVDIFFVISGFVISRTYLYRLSDRETSLREFYLRRVRRLAPAYFVVLIATSAIAFYQLEPELLLNFGNSLLAQPFYAQNFVFWLQGDYFAAASTKPLLHTWSLAVEEQFYILFGLTILVLRKWKYLMRPILVAGFLGSLVLGMLVVEISPKSSFYLLPTRIWEFVLGIGAFLVTRDFKWRISASVSRFIYYLCLLGLLVAVFSYAEASKFPGGQSYMACVSTALLLFLFEKAPIRDHRAFRSKIGVFLGKRSYSLYLWHWPIIALATTSSEGKLAWHDALLSLAFSVLLSDLTYRYLENPIRKGRIISDSGALLRGFVATSVAIVGLGATTIATKGLLQRYEEPVRTYFGAAQYKSPRRCSRIGRVLHPKREFCLARESRESLDGRLGLLIIGDSHADAVDEVISQTGNAFDTPVYLTVRNCDLNEYGVKDYCNKAVHDEVFRQISHSKIGAVIAISFWYDDQIDADFDQNLARLAELGVHVFLMETVPNGDYFDPTVRAKSLLVGETDSAKAYDMNSYMEQYPNLTRRFVEFEKKYNGRVNVLRPRDYLCDLDGHCDFATAGYPNYFDDDHVNNIGAERLIPMFETVFQSLTLVQKVDR